MPTYDVRECGSLQYIDDLVRKFSAQDKTYSVTKFIEDIDENAVIFGWTPLQRLIVARRSMTGTAALWLRAERPFKSWDELKHALSRDFPDTIDIKAVHELMAARKKKKDESCLDYLLTMRELGKRGKMPDYVAIQYIVDGIQDLETNKMMLYGVTSYSELKEKIKIYETIKNKMSTHSQGSQSQHNTKNNRPKPVFPTYKKKCYSCGEDNHVSSTCPHRGKGTKCFRCNQFGHISAQCTNSATGRKSAGGEHNGGAGGSRSANSNENELNGTNLCVRVDVRTNKLDNECASNGTTGSDLKMAAMAATNVKRHRSVTDSDSDSSYQTRNSTDRKPIKKILLCNRSINALIDSGSDVNLVSEDCYKRLGAPSYNKRELLLTGLGATRVISPGYINTNIVIDEECFSVILHLVPRDIMPYDIILGQELLHDVTVIMNGNQVQLLKRDESWLRNYSCDVFVSDVLGYGADPEIQREVRQLVDSYQPVKTRGGPNCVKDCFERRHPSCSATSATGVD
ncbi:uncharacterized protein [Choristoneura fumiferana]|uniref:uncharacterized protein n=1 Tax=Choristoneura fumiferana TaxID=7141 RepID=UPI003D159448